ncbi:MAG TPA: hypothetical protein VJ571_06040 [Candidatus Nitrosotalea sp.]|nr:hypothetical protein [Candidatus Nitrosotalea sp.]
MSFTEKILQSKQVKEAIGEGIVRLLVTGNLNNGMKAMITKGKQNGSITALKIAFVLDILKTISCEK